MCEVTYVNANKIFPAIIDLLEQGIGVRITVTGMSMYPFLHGNRDVVELVRTRMDDVRRGDIVLIRRDSGEYVLHRIFRRSREGFFIVGDAQQWIEGPLKPNQLLAKASVIWRKSRCIPCSKTVWKLVGAVWLLMLPYRQRMIKLYRAYTNIFFRR
jgi:hypothetical protein